MSPTGFRVFSVIAVDGCEHEAGLSPATQLCTCRR